MTLVRLKNKSTVPGFNNFMDGFFPVMPSLLRSDFNTTGSKQNTPVNVKEKEGLYQLQVVAPGFAKEDFRIDLDQNILTIAAERKNEEGKAKETVVRREYSFLPFKRSFNLDENIDAEAITAEYVNGVLTLNLPKKAEVKEPTKQINIQ